MHTAPSSSPAHPASSPSPSLTRRGVLRGMGAAVGLPFLGSLAPRAASAAAGAGDDPPVRMACLFMPNGVNAEHWEPEGKGSQLKLSKTLSPLASVQDDVNVISNLWNRASQGGDGHYVKCSGWLTSTTITKTTGKDLNAGGISMDQLAARKIGGLTRLPSIELGIEPVTTGIDTNVNYTRLYGSFISWKTPTTPLACELHPQLAFDRLFRVAPRAPGEDESVLDLVQEDAKRILARAGSEDRHKIEEYLEAVRSVEERIAADARQQGEERVADPRAVAAIERLGIRIKDYLANPSNAREVGTIRPGDHTEQVRIMMDLMVLAFWSDTTRIATFMFGNAVSGKNFSFLDGVSGAHHEISHHKGNEDQLEQYQRINQWHVAQYAYMLERMKAIPEGEGTLLDNSMVLFGSGFRDGNAHNPHNVPLVLGGRGGGTIRTGRHLEYDKDAPLSDLYVSMLDRVGAPVNSFADSGGELKNLS